MTGTAAARRLRRELTEAEGKLWARLRDRRLGVKFRRQLPIDRFIVDFASEEAKVVIEVDGSQHALAPTRDRDRTAVLEARGFLVLRFWNNQVLEDIDVVLDEIIRTLASRGTRVRPLPKGEGFAP
jgi:very-short-patch-repair endonuclease